jgi:UDP-glucose 4-epimerase
VTRGDETPLRSDPALGRVLVTGGMGFIGSNLVRRLDALGADVLVVDNLLEGQGGNPFNLQGSSARVRMLRHDLRDPAVLPGLLEGRDLVFNLAAQTSHLGSMTDPMTDLSINVTAQLQLLEACRRLAPRARVVFASTRQVYGEARRLPVDETHPTHPLDVNGWNKLVAEGYHQLYHRVYGLRTTVLRLTNTYGPRMRVRDARQTFVGAWIGRAVRGEPFEVWGGEQLRDLCQVDDLVEAFIAATAPALEGGVYNVGGASAVTLRELADALARVSGGGYEIRPFPAERKRIDIGDFHADDTLFRSLTGWRPRIGLEAGLRAAVDYYREHLAHYA